MPGSAAFIRDATQSQLCLSILRRLSNNPQSRHLLPIPHIDIVQISATAYNPAASRDFPVVQIILPWRTIGSGSPYSGADTYYGTTFKAVQIRLAGRLKKSSYVGLVG
jgi:hypothetical protein